MIKNEKNENEVGIVTIKNSPNSISEQFLLDIKKSSSFLKETNITSENKDSNIQKNNSSIPIKDGENGEEIKSKSSFFKKNKKNKKNEKNEKKNDKKNDFFKINKKKGKEKIPKLLKNKERLKIPFRKRMSIGNDNTKLSLKNLDNIDKIIKSLPNQPVKVRLDINGNEINKKNRKKVHITFLDTIPTKKLIEVIPIQSYKQYNIIEKIQEPDLYYNKCCIIF